MRFACAEDARALIGSRTNYRHAAAGYNLARCPAPVISRWRQRSTTTGLQFERLAGEADALVKPLTDEQFNWSPVPGAWSIAQCIDHLNVTARLYLPRIDEGIADAIRRGLYGEGPFTHDLIGRLFVGTMEPPARIKIKAPESFQPGAPRARAPRSWPRSAPIRSSSSIACARRTASTCAGPRCTRQSSSWLKMSLSSGFALMAAHERRHLWQAQQVVEAAGFPGNTPHGESIHGPLTLFRLRCRLARRLRTARCLIAS